MRPITVVLDSQPLSLLAENRKGDGTTQRLLAFLRAHSSNGGAIVPANVIAETCQGANRTASVDSLLTREGLTVVDVNRALAKAAGAMLFATKRKNEDLVDATVVASAGQSRDQCIVVTGEQGRSNDVASFAARHPHKITVQVLAEL